MHPSPLPSFLSRHMRRHRSSNSAHPSSCCPFYRDIRGGTVQAILHPPSPVLPLFVIFRFNSSAASSVTKAGAVPHFAVLPRPLWWHTAPRRSVGNRPSFARASARGGPFGFHGIQIGAVKPAAFGALHRDADIRSALRQHRPLLAPWTDEPKAVILFLRHRTPPFHRPDAGPVP